MNESRAEELCNFLYSVSAIRRESIDVRNLEFLLVAFFHKKGEKIECFPRLSSLLKCVEKNIEAIKLVSEDDDYKNNIRGLSRFTAIRQSLIQFITINEHKNKYVMLGSYIILRK